MLTSVMLCAVDQQEVLRRSKHVVELTDGRLVLSVRGNLSHDSTAAAPAEVSTTFPSGFLIRQHKHVTGPSGMFYNLLIHISALHVFSFR